MKDWTFQIEKAKHIRKGIEEKSEAMKPRAAMIGLCDVILEVLANMQDREPKFEDFMRKYGTPQEKQITIAERKAEVIEMLRICRNELENKTLFPSLDQTEVMLLLDMLSGERVHRNAGFLVQRILETIEQN